MAGDSPASILFDINGNPVSVSNLRLVTTDIDVTSALKDILAELKQIKQHLEIINEVEF